MKNTFFTLLFCSIGNIVLAQANFQNGFIVTSRNDTISGLINLTSDLHLKCEFITASDAKETISYLPDQLKSFWIINGKNYASKKLFGAGDRFLEVIVKGNLSLYSYKDRFFIEKNDTSLYELTLENSKYREGNEFRSRGNRSLGIFKYFLSDCPERLLDLDEFVFNEKYLHRLVLDYYLCVDEKPKFIKDIKVKEKKGPDMGSPIPLVIGSLSLYKTKTEYFVKKESDTARYQLSSENSVAYINGVKMSYKGNKSIGILKYLMSDCPETLFEVNDFNLNENYLIRLFKRYHDCIGEEPEIFTNNKDKISSSFGIAAGFNYSFLNIDSDIPNYLTADYTPAYSGIAGVNFDFKVNNIALSASMYYQNVSFSNVSDKTREAYHEINYVNFDLNQLKFLGGVKYIFNKHTISPYLSVGAILTKNIKSKAELNRFFTYDGVPRESTNDLNVLDQGLYPGVYGALGGFTKLSSKTDIFTEMRVERIGGITNNGRYSSRIFNIQLVIGVKLNANVKE